MLFRKLKIEATEVCKASEKWYLILRTFEDVCKYMELDIQLHINALLSIPGSIEKSHLEGVRETVLNTMIQTKASFLKEGEKVSPPKVLSDLMDRKSQSFFKLIENGQDILVQQHGSYCTYKGYVETWKAVVTDEIEKDTCFYPTDNEPIETDVLFIENGERVPVDFEKQVNEILGYTSNDNTWTVFNDATSFNYHKNINTTKRVKYKLTHLKLRDPKFVLGMISKAKTIALESQFVDKEQIDSMLQIFASLEHKNVIISSMHSNDLTSNPLFDKCSKIHTIKFL